MKQKYSAEVWGAGLEAAGLLVLLIAAAFQAYLSDWFPKENAEWVVYEQTIVNRGLLLTLQDINAQLATNEVEQRKYANNSAYERIKSTYASTFDEDERRRAVQKGSASVFSNVRFFLFTTGALLIVIGKGLTFRHKLMKERAPL